MFRFALKLLNPATGGGFGLILLLAVAALFYYGNQRIDGLKVNNDQLTEQIDVLDTQLLEMEQHVQQQQEAITRVLHSQVSIRQTIATKKKQVTEQTGERSHAAKQNPDALGSTITGNLADIMQQFHTETRH